MKMGTVNRRLAFVTAAMLVVLASGSWFFIKSREARTKSSEVVLFYIAGHVLGIPTDCRYKKPAWPAVKSVSGQR